MASGAAKRFCTCTPLFGSESISRWFVNDCGTLSVGVHVTEPVKY